MLRFDGFRAATLTNLFFFVLDFRKQLDDAAGIFLELRRFGLDVGFQDTRGLADSSGEIKSWRSVYGFARLSASAVGSARVEN